MTVSDTAARTLPFESRQEVGAFIAAFEGRRVPKAQWTHEAHLALPKLLAATILVAVLSAGVARAMEIQRFDRMAAADQGDYIILLIAGAQQVLRDAGRDDLAAQVRKLFTVRQSGATLSIGMMEFETNLTHARAVDADTHAHDRSAERLDVEQALIVTLKWNGIVLPRSFMQIGAHFKPKRRR